MKKITIVQSSLRKGSHTEIVCREFETKAKDAWFDVSYINLVDIELEFCEGRALWEYNADLNTAYKTMDESEVIIFGMPVYQYSMSWVLKNFIDIVWWSLKSKKVWVIVNAGWPNCYMASRDLLNALYYECATTNISPTPYSWFMDFKDWKIVNEKVIEKLEELVEKIK